MNKEESIGVSSRSQAWTHKISEGSLRNVLSKLFTIEDDKQVHKVLGIVCLISFLYRYGYVYPTTGTLGFDGSWLDHATMFAHLALSCTSLIFHVIRHRIVSRPMIIWQEYRLHAIIFTTRCVSVYLMAVFRPFQQHPLLERCILPLVVLAHHIGADQVTQKHGSKDGVTTVRVKDEYGSSTKSVLRFYAFYQFTALASHLTPNARLADLGYNTFIAIQSSAFLMTLYRKGVITEVTHALVYTACLIISMFHIFRNCGDAMFIAKLAGAYILRTDFRLNKYVLWLSFALLSVPAVTDALTAKLLEITGDSFGAQSVETIQWACGQHDLLSQFCKLNASLRV